MSLKINGTNSSVTLTAEADAGGYNIEIPNGTLVKDTDLKEIGVDQVWTLFASPARDLDTEYTNNTGKPISVSVSHASTGGTHELTPKVDGVIILRNGSNINQSLVLACSFIVPDGSTYELTSIGTPSVVYWSELR